TCALPIFHRHGQDLGGRAAVVDVEVVVRERLQRVRQERRGARQRPQGGDLGLDVALELGRERGGEQRRAAGRRGVGDERGDEVRVALLAARAQEGAAGDGPEVVRGGRVVGLFGAGAVVHAGRDRRLPGGRGREASGLAHRLERRAGPRDVGRDVLDGEQGAPGRRGRGRGGAVVALDDGDD